MILHIKFMVSIRCKMIVQEELLNIGLTSVKLDLGTVEIFGNITSEQRLTLKTALMKSGLELMDDKKAILIERIKGAIIEMIHGADSLPKMKFSSYLSASLNHDYTYLANTFSEVKGITIEQFIIIHKIEKVKELIIYNELNLNEISYKLNYSSAAALSNQFKKITGLTPSFYKQLKEKRKMNLEDV